MEITKEFSMIHQKAYYLIDMENVYIRSVADIKSRDSHFIFFFGKNQKIPSSIEAEIKENPSRFTLINFNIQGKNALDSKIILHLGSIIYNEPHCVYYIISNDKDYDAIIKSLSEDGFFIQRKSVLSEVRIKINITPKKIDLSPSSTSSKPATNNFNLILNKLNLDISSKPSNKNRLFKFIEKNVELRSHSKITERNRVVKKLKDAGIIKFYGGRVEYLL